MTSIRYTTTPEEIKAHFTILKKENKTGNLTLESFGHNFKAKHGERTLLLTLRGTVMGCKTERKRFYSVSDDYRDSKGKTLKILHGPDFFFEEDIKNQGIEHFLKKIPQEKLKLEKLKPKQRNGMKEEYFGKEFYPPTNPVKHTLIAVNVSDRKYCFSSWVHHSNPTSELPITRHTANFFFVVFQPKSKRNRD